MLSNFVTQTIDFISPHHKDFQNNERAFWDSHWKKMSEYYKKNGEIFEINDPWDFNCNKALHHHYRSIIGDFKDLSCIECGCGGGFESALMAKDGARASVLDYSKEAISYAKLVNSRVVKENKINFVNKNIFDYHPSIKYDLAWNCGVIEHYSDKDIVAVLRKMRSLTKKGGQIVTTIPNLLSPQAIYWMLTEGKTSERYFTRNKITKLFLKAGLKKIKITNFSFWLPAIFPYEWAIKLSKLATINRLNPLVWLFSIRSKNN